jgi:histidine triad (HIT) family protein
MAEIPDKTIGILFSNVKLLTKALENALHANGTLIAINDKVSQSKPHLHIHVIPRKFGDGFRGTFWPRYRYHSKEEIIKMQEKIKEALKSIK